MKNKQIILFGAIFVIACTISVAIWLFTPGWVVLLPGQNSEGMKASIMNYLVQSGARYKIDGSTQEVLVRSDEVQALRSRLSTAGLPIQDQKGFELFDGAGYGMSEFLQGMNYQRALEVELARTIRTLHGVKTARVHLTLEKESLFKERQKTAKASVVIELAENGPLALDKIEGIKEIVATSVAGLTKDAVSVIDIYGKPISGVAGELSGFQTRNEQVEEEIRSKIRSLLVGVFPDKDIRIGVNVEVDLSKRTSTEESLVPKNESGDGFIIKSKKLGSSESGADRSGESVPRSSKTEEVEYSYSTERVETIFAPGAIKRIGVGVVIVGESVSEDWINKIESLVAATIGIDALRGDSVKVLVIPQELANLGGKAEVSSVDANAASEQHRLFATDEAGDKRLSNANLDNEKQSHGFWGRYLNLNVAVFLALCFGLLSVIQTAVIISGYFRSRSKSLAALNDEEKQRVVQEFKTWMGQ